MNIYEALREDHDKQRRLVDLLLKTKGASEGRAELLERLKTELQAHAAAEERHFYVPLFDSDLTQEKARHSVAEHHEIDELIERVEQADPSTSGWLAAARALGDKVTHHLDEEEQEVFQQSGKVLSDKQKSDLARQYQQEMEEQKV
tara:strand:+ start:503 stop:940 length:438 start_codon:yes stop_codon:yes gene_type:complete